MTPRRAAIGFTVLAAGLAIVYGSKMLRDGLPGAPAGGEGTGVAAGNLVAQGYPPPGGTLPPPTAVPPTSTPQAQPDGHFPVPASPPNRVEKIGDSEFGDLLGPLQAELQAGSAGVMVERMSERFGMTLYDMDHLDSEGGTNLSSEDAQALLEDFFNRGSQPIVQAYFENGGGGGDGGVPCVEVLIAPLVGGAAHPAFADADDYGPRPPETIEDDAATLGMCRTGGGDWIWQRWAYGGYHRMLDKFYRARGASGWQLVIVRP